MRGGVMDFISTGGSVSERCFFVNLVLNAAV